MERINQSKIKAVFLDFDGTMVDTEKLHYEAFNKVLIEENLTAVSWSEYKKNYLGRRSEKSFEFVSDKNGVLGKNPFRMKLKKTKYFQDLLQHSKGFDGLLEFIDYLKEKQVIVHVTTSGHRENVSISLKSLGLLDLPLTSREDVLNIKPATDIFDKTAKLYDLMPFEILIIEDSPNGLKAAKSFGSKRIALMSSYDEKELAEFGPDFFVKDFIELKQIFDKQYL